MTSNRYVANVFGVRWCAIVAISLLAICGCSISTAPDPRCVKLTADAYSTKDIREMFEQAGWKIRASDARVGCTPTYSVLIFTTAEPLSNGYRAYIAGSSIVHNRKSTYPKTYLATGATRIFTLNYVIGEMLKDLEGIERG